MTAFVIIIGIVCLAIIMLSSSLVGRTIAMIQTYITIIKMLSLVTMVILLAVPTMQTLNMLLIHMLLFNAKTTTRMLEG